MKTIGRITDKMLSAFLPKAEAGACVPEAGSVVHKHCYCTGHREYMKRCTIGCTGTLSCGTCYGTQNVC